MSKITIIKEKKKIKGQHRKEKKKMENKRNETSKRLLTQVEGRKN